jgi:hypothetical protein
MTVIVPFLSATTDLLSGARERGWPEIRCVVVLEACSELFREDRRLKIRRNRGQQRGMLAARRAVEASRIYH